ncbi:MAG TPA: hypothetical protein VF473_05330 [Cyclobacteriaceae bacterium]
MKSQKRMDVTELREELHELINNADEKILSLMHAFITAKDDTLLTEEQERLLHLTIREHEAGRSKSYTWAEVRALIEKKRR